MLNKKIIFLTNVLWNLFKTNTHKMCGIRAKEKTS